MSRNKKNAPVLENRSDFRYEDSPPPVAEFRRNFAQSQRGRAAHPPVLENRSDFRYAERARRSGILKKFRPQQNFLLTNQELTL